MLFRSGVNPPAPNQNPVVAWDVSNAYMTSTGARYGVAGWAFDPSNPQAPTYVDFTDRRPDGTVGGARLTTSSARVDVAAAFPGTRLGTGFATTIAPVPGVHTFCLYGINSGAGATTSLGCNRPLPRKTTTCSRSGTRSCSRRRATTPLWAP